MERAAPTRHIPPVVPPRRRQIDVSDVPRPPAVLMSDYAHNLSIGDLFMFQSLLAIPVILAFAAPARDSLKPAEKKLYDTAKAAAAGDAAKLTTLALWCESHGMDAERAELLAEAVEADPDHPLARGLQRQVAHGERWETPEEAAARVKADGALTAKLAEYNARRAKIDQVVEYESNLVNSLKGRGMAARANYRRAQIDRKLAPAHIKLGLWCEQNGLKAEALANFTAAVHIDPHNDATWRHLGYIRHNGQWMSHEQIAAAEREAAEQKHADRHWEPLLSKWAGHLKDPARRDEAEKLFSQVHDPRAVPSIVRLFAEKSPAGEAFAIRLLGQIDAPAATRELGVLSIFGDSAEIRRDAALALKGREPRDYADIVVNLVHTPWTYQAQPPAGVGTQGFLVIDSPRFHLVRSYEAPAPFRLASNFRGYFGYGPDGLPSLLSGNDIDRIEGRRTDTVSPSQAVQLLRAGEEKAMELMAAANLKSALAQQRFMADVNDIETSNARAVELNRRVSEALTTSLDAPGDLRDDDEDGWRSWYYEKIGYRYTPPAKVTLAMNATPTVYPPTIVSCFAAGTPVATITGPRPIETLRVGDQVLSQDVNTGGLSYQPILVVHHNPPDKTLRVRLANGDSAVASLFHRFWIADHGWKMARDLSAGDVVRTLGGPSPITALEPAPVQPVFNLDVASSRTYFVGASSMLVHDNTLPPPHDTAAPFDRVPTFEVTAR